MMRLSVITVHFFDFGWIELLVRRLAETTPEQQLLEILVVDQDRTESSRLRLLGLDPRIRVFHYPPSARHFQAMGHDHPYVLDCVLREAKGSHILILDSDAHPFSEAWLPKCQELLRTHDALLASAPRQVNLSHPCFMLLKTEHLALDLKFDLGLFDQGIDTGRLIGEQLRLANQKVLLLPAKPGFQGKWGCIYLDCIYHHGSGSFAGGDSRLKSQIVWAHRIYRSAVIVDGVYYLKLRRRIDYVVSGMVNKLVSSVKHSTNRKSKT